MAFIPVTNVLEVDIRGTLFNNEVENVLYFSREATITPTDVDALFTWLEDEFVTDGMFGRTVSYTVDELYGTDLTSSSAPTYTRVISPPIVGNDVSSPGSPGNVAFCLSFRTNARGRSARGRNYLAGLTETIVTGNLVSSTWADAQVNNYERMLVGGELPTGWTWVQVSRFFEGAPRVAGLTREVTAVLYTDLEVDTMRGRLD